MPRPGQRSPTTKPGGHSCKINTPFSGYGDAVKDCEEDTDGRFWVGNDEYGTQVVFCPQCGTKAPTPPETEP